ncbi:PLL family lectin [Streptacidiphilus sp. PAMC 29251]
MHVPQRTRTFLTLSIAVTTAAVVGLGGSTSAFASPGASPASSSVKDRGGAGQGPVTPVGQPTNGRTGVRSLATPQVSAPTLTRSQVLSRAAGWVGLGLVYTHTGAEYQGYREDCSGYVSMAWELGASLDTTSFVPDGVASWISKGALKPGDALLNDAAGSAGHIVIFAGWTDSSQTSYMGYEFTGTGVHYRSIPYPYFAGFGTFKPVRNNSVVDDPSGVPDTMHVDTIVGGNVYDNQRNGDGSWTGSSLLDQGGGIAQSAVTGLANGTMHVQTLVAGKVYDRQRNTGGSWSDPALLDGSGSITAVASASLPDGTMHVDTVVGGKVYDNQRNANGGWTGAALVDGGGGVSAISVAGLPNGTLHVQTLAGGKVYDNQRNTNGSWTGPAIVDGGGGVSAIASAGLPDGTMHVDTLAGGKVYDNQRNTNGSWTGAAIVDGSGSISDIAASGLHDGTLHIQTLTGGKVYDNQRNTNGSWTGAAIADSSGYITSIASGGFGSFNN